MILYDWFTVSCVICCVHVTGLTNPPKVPPLSCGMWFVLWQLITATFAGADEIGRPASWVSWAEPLTCWRNRWLTMYYILYMWSFCQKHEHILCMFSSCPSSEVGGLKGSNGYAFGENIRCCGWLCVHRFGEFWPTLEVGSGATESGGSRPLLAPWLRVRQPQQVLWLVKQIHMYRCLTILPRVTVNSVEDARYTTRKWS